jgi:hypothetical protein
MEVKTNLVPTFDITGLTEDEARVLACILANIKLGDGEGSPSDAMCEINVKLQDALGAAGVIGIVGVSGDGVTCKTKDNMIILETDWDDIR